MGQVDAVQHFQGDAVVPLAACADSSCRERYALPWGAAADYKLRRDGPARLRVFRVEQVGALLNFVQGRRAAAKPQYSRLRVERWPDMQRRDDNDEALQRRHHVPAAHRLRHVGVGGMVCLQPCLREWTEGKKKSNQGCTWSRWQSMPEDVSRGCCLPQRRLRWRYRLQVAGLARMGALPASTRALWHRLQATQT